MRPAPSAVNWPTKTPPRSRYAQALDRGGGEGRIRTSEATRATDLQSVAFDRSATSPLLMSARSLTEQKPPAVRTGGLADCRRTLTNYCVMWNSLQTVWMAPNTRSRFAFTLELAKGFEPPTR